MNLDHCFRGKPTVLVLTVALALIALIGWLDRINGWEISLFVFYAIPILLAVWYTNVLWGIVASLLCAVTWYWANADSGPWSTSLAFLWATASRLIYFSFVAIGGNAVKMRQVGSQARIEALERARGLEEEIVRISEHEKRRFGRDLHDGLCQELAAIGLAANALGEELQAERSPHADAAREVKTLLRDAVIHARDLARGIFPVQMDEAGLVASLEELARTTNRLLPDFVSFEISGDPILHDPEVAMHLYRIAQEALGNAMKHAGGSHVQIRLEADDDAIRLTVRDNGKGWVPEDSNAGMGVRTMTYRAQAIGATLEVSRGPHGGTTISCSQPSRTRKKPSHEYAAIH